MINLKGGIVGRQGRMIDDEGRMMNNLAGAWNYTTRRRRNPPP